MSTPKSHLGNLVSKIAAEKTRIFERIDPRLTTFGAVIILTVVSAVTALPLYANGPESNSPPTNVAEAAVAVDKSLAPYLEISDTINTILRRGLREIASIDFSPLSEDLASKTIRAMANATLADLPEANDRPLETAASSNSLAGAYPDKIMDLAHSAQVGDGFEAILKAISAAKGVSPDVLQKLASRALSDVGAEVPALAHLDLLAAIENANILKALALHEIQDELKSLKADKDPDYPQASRDLTDSALSGLNGDLAAERVAVKVLAKAEMAAGGEHGAEVTAAYNKSVALDEFFTVVIGKYVDGDRDPATFAELAEKAQAQLTAFESADAPSAHKM